MNENGNENAWGEPNAGVPSVVVALTETGPVTASESARCSNKAPRSSEKCKAGENGGQAHHVSVGISGDRLAVCELLRTIVVQLP